MNATIAARAHHIGLTVSEALWDYPLSVVLQMIHADSTANGGDFDWVHAGEPSQAILDEYDRLSEISVEDLLG